MDATDLLLPLIGALGAAFTLSLILVLRLYAAMRGAQRRRLSLISEYSGGAPAAPLVSIERGSASLMAVLGSGGHTAEMLTLMHEVRTDVGRRQGIKLSITYVVGRTDSHSIDKARQLHLNDVDVTYVKLPRAREVGQSWASSAMSSAHTTLWAMCLVLRRAPDVLLLNGPGTSAVVAAVAFLYRVLLRRRCRIVYVESFARVHSMSMSGRIVYPFADRFIVQWDELGKQWPLAEYYGRLC